MDNVIPLRKTMPRRRPNAELRDREHLTPDEIDRLMEAAGSVGRHRHRDPTLILVCFRHGLRVSELVALRWEQVNLTMGVMHVVRRKNGLPSTHPIIGAELRALRKLKRDYPDTPYLFVTERKGPLSVSVVQGIVKRAGWQAGFQFQIHPQMVRHSTGFKLANDGHDTRAIQLYMGHANIQNTVRYTQLAANRFNGFWDD